MYIVKICQPQFSVVKDEALTPVGPGQSQDGAFVLVPLPLMLEGYTLLPGEMKKKIADDYESSKSKARFTPVSDEELCDARRSSRRKL
jgi:hypothetical protein